MGGRGRVGRFHGLNPGMGWLFAVAISLGVGILGSAWVNLDLLRAVALVGSGAATIALS